MARSITGRSIGRGGILASILVALGIFLAGNQPAAASTEAERLVDESRISIERMLADPEFFKLKEIIGKARGVLIVPEMFKGGFIVGAEGGSGVLMVRGADGSWSAPAFYTLAAGSIGFQIGGQVSEVVFTLMNDAAVNALLNNEFKFGADAGVAVGPIGAGVEASTTSNLERDIYAFSKSVGLFGGGVLEGGKILEQKERNRQYYGAIVKPREVLIERKYFNVHADPLRKILP